MVLIVRIAVVVTMTKLIPKPYRRHLPHSKSHRLTTNMATKILIFVIGAGKTLNIKLTGILLLKSCRVSFWEFV